MVFEGCCGAVANSESASGIFQQARNPDKVMKLAAIHAYLGG